ncbi:hypothetical protein, partial [Streptomyces sp. A012304]|uniref:hypothetical protein n=1 Tax=Streptomyces sp. A012304 TaxID=375446 RepID=UPI00222F887C
MAAAFAVASRRWPGRITIPFWSTLITSSVWAGAGRAGRIERGDVHVRGPHQILHLAFARHPAAAAAVDRFQGGVVGTAGRFEDREPAQSQAVPAVGQAQHGVGGVEVDHARAAQGASGHGHRPQHGGQLPPVALLQPAPAAGERGPLMRTEGQQVVLLVAG